MSDTRAAIRELRSLSEKRSLNALTDSETARWTALRRQLGLPLEPAEEPASPTSLPRPAPAGATTAAPASVPNGSLGASPARERSVATQPAVPEAGPSAPAEAAPEVQSAEDVPQPEPWTGPSLDSPAAPGTAAWVGPAIDAPAWLEAAADQPTDPGLDEPPPVPFDEAPAAPRPLHESESGEFGGSPEERPPLATASDFVSYARDGNEAIELPTDSGRAEDLQPQTLAQLAEAQPDVDFAGATSSQSSESKSPHPDASSEAQNETDALASVPPLAVEAALPAAPENSVDDGLGPETPAQAFPEFQGASDGVLPEPPVDRSSEATSANAHAFPEPVLEQLLTDAPGLNAGVLPEPPLQLEPLSPAPPGSTGDGLAEPPTPLQLGALQYETPESQAGAAADEHEADGHVQPLPAPVSTWEPGSAEPPVLGTDDFAPSGEALGGRGLDPWPEALEAALPTEDTVENVDDEDLVDEGSTPTPLPPLPVSPPPGSGGIRGFQFPRPPPGPVPVPPTPPAWQRTQPGVPPFSTSASSIRPAAAAPTTPAPAPPQSRPLSGTGFVSTPPQPPKAVPAAAVAPTTPAPTPQQPRTLSGTGFVTTPALPQPPKAIPAAAVAPTTPPSAPTRPLAATSVAPLTPQPIARASSPLGNAPTGPLSTQDAPRAVPAAPATVPPRTPVPTAPRAPASSPPAARTDEESVQPLLELVDVVEPPRAAAPQRRPATPSPPRGTAAVFGAPMMLAPSIVEGNHRVVIHTLEGQVHRGTVQDLDLQDYSLAVQQSDGRSVRIPTQKVKAVFFVLAPGGKPLPTKGERVQVTFRDGRQVVGYSDDHASGEPGFFVVPSDARTNTARVYVFRGGVQSITTG